ncbi:helix-turn-helix domain-containing protein [Corynebacterium renale]|nr:helix-turn-helix domain-containing protein [Corynebacterium renale]
MNHNTTFLTVKEFSARSGYSEQFVRRLVRRGEIRSGRRRGATPRKGLKILIPEQELDRFCRMDPAA